uniref:Uncharacterized protein n=1 Tax=Naja naja TaxID=35670 RepID=A0A8C6VL58_NAJNA
MPFVRGPEDRHFFACFKEKDSNAFLKSNPFLPPEDKNYLLAPHRDDVPIINPCSGFLSPGGKVDRQILDNRAYEPLRDGKDAHSSQQAPVFCRKTQAGDRKSLLLREINQDQRWNSRAVPDISVRSRLGGKYHCHYNCHSIFVCVCMCVCKCNFFCSIISVLRISWTNPSSFLDRVFQK